MKKLLALVLALVMTLGLATVSSSAAYSDEADVSLNEAVDVMSAVGVFQGADGKFSPKENLTREQAAKLIAYLDLGESAAEALPGVKVFSDVEATRWSAKYIAYCQDAGYIAGVGDGKFNPTGDLTGYAFGKMVLCVLGYDADIEGFTGNAWSINVAKLLEKNDINDGVSGAASATLTREQAAQYCLNALKATMVDYESKGTNVTINGAVIATGASKAKVVEQGNYENLMHEDNLQLAEKLYNKKLEKKVDPSDDFGRPASKWTFTENGKTSTIGTYAETADFTTVVAKTYDSQAALIKGIADALDLNVNDYDFDETEVYFNGMSGDAYRAATKTNKAQATAALFRDINNYGVVVELFLNDDDSKVVDKLVAYQYSLIEVTDVDTYAKGDDRYDDYGETKQYTIEIGRDTDRLTDISSLVAELTGDVKNAYTYVDTTKAKSSDGNYQKLGDLAEDDRFIAVVNPLNGKILSKVAATSTVEGKATGVGARYAKIDGTQYGAAQVWNKKDEKVSFIDLNDKGTFYLDPNDIIIAKDITETVTVDDALYVVTAWDDTETKYGAPTTTIYVQVVDMTGAVKELVVGIDKKGTADDKGITKDAAEEFIGTLVKATSKSSGKYYELTAWNTTDYQQAAFTPVTLKTNTTKASGYRLNSATKYIVVEDSGADIDVTVKQGGISYKVDDGDTGRAIYKTSNGNKVASYVIIKTKDYTTNSAEDLLYVDAAADFELTSVKDDDYNTFTAYNTKGEKVTVITESKPADVAGFQEYSVDKDGIYTFEKATKIKLDGATYDDEAGYVANLSFDSYYETLLTDSSKVYVDVETKDAKIIDLHDSDKAGQWSRTVNTLAAMKKAKDAGCTVTFDMYLDDGATVIFVTNVSKGH